MLAKTDEDTHTHTQLWKRVFTFKRRKDFVGDLTIEELVIMGRMPLESTLLTYVSFGKIISSFLATVSFAMERLKVITSSSLLGKWAIYQQWRQSCLGSHCSTETSCLSLYNSPPS